MVDFVAWLLAPIDAARPHTIDLAASWHGRLMVLAWGILLPLGVCVARFAKILPWQDWPRELDNTTWWHGHRTLQYGAGAFFLAAIAFGLWIPGDAPDGFWHRLLGWGVAVLLAVQFVSAWLRGTKGGPTSPAPDGTLRGDHYDMTARRLAFEHVHKRLGYIALALAVAAVLTGLWLVNAPHWMWLVLGLWWLALATVAFHLQARGFQADTYHAIWGPSPEHPGNGDRRVRHRWLAND